MSQHLLCTFSSVSHAIHRYVVSDFVTRTETTLENDTVTMCSEDQNNDTTLILTTSFTWRVFLTSIFGSRDEGLQTCSSVRGDDAVLDLETLRAPCPSDLRMCCRSSRKSSSRPLRRCKQKLELSMAAKSIFPSNSTALNSESWQQTVVIFRNSSLV